MREPMSAIVRGIVLVLGGCASAQGGSGSKVQRASVGANSSLITRNYTGAELASIEYLDAGHATSPPRRDVT